LNMANDKKEVCVVNVQNMKCFVVNDVSI
jgi:hypothetical protein